MVLRRQAKRGIGACKGHCATHQISLHHRPLLCHQSHSDSCECMCMSPSPVQEWLGSKSPASVILATCHLACCDESIDNVPGPMSASQLVIQHRHADHSTCKAQGKASELQTGQIFTCQFAPCRSSMREPCPRPSCAMLAAKLESRLACWYRRCVCMGCWGMPGNTKPLHRSSWCMR